LVTAADSTGFFGSGLTSGVAGFLVSGGAATSEGAGLAASLVGFGFLG
jgi:hypothetical protein